MTVEPLIEPVPVGWRTTTLGEACSEGGGNIQTGPFGSQLHASDYVVGGIPSVMPQNIGENRIDAEGIAGISATDAKRLSRYLLNAGDIVYSRRGDVERRALVRDHEAGWLCGTGCLRVRFGSRDVDPLFASYQLAHPEVRSWIVRHAIGATMPNLNTSILSALPFLLPPPAEQRSIAQALGALDDKIDLNRRMNETLEAIARAIFESWFVDFDPVRAKAEGREQAGMDARTAALFPSSLVESAIGPVPSGWRLSHLGEVTTTVLGGTPARDEPAFWDGGTVPWINSGKVNEFRITTPSERITERGVKESATKLVPSRSVVLAITGATLGQVSLLEIESCVNQSVVAVLSSDAAPSEYLYFWIRHRIDDLLGRQTGGAQQHVNKNDVNELILLVPSRAVMEAFIQRVRPIFDRIRVNCFESGTLTTLRDTLLPKLLSGEIRIPVEGESG